MIPPDFAEEWEAAWNAHDLDRILSHYASGIVFRSAKALKTVGRGKVEGRNALRMYWSSALERQPDLRFTVLDVFEGFDTMVLVYLNHAGRRAAETVRFDGAGQIVEASACHTNEGRDT